MKAQGIVEKKEIQSGVCKLVRRSVLTTMLIGSLALVSPAIAAAGPSSRKEVRVPRVDRGAIENLQRWVSGGHDTWCKDPQLVASAEMRRIAPEFAGYQFASLPLETKSQAASRAEFHYTSLDGRNTYHITLRRYEWLLPLAGNARSIVWVPSRVEIVTNP